MTQRHPDLMLPPIPNANTEAVPRINFLIIVISRVLEVSEISEIVKSRVCVEHSGRHRVAREQACQKRDNR